MEFLKDKDGNVIKFDFTSNTGEKFNLFFEQIYLSEAKVNYIVSYLKDNINIKTVIEPNMDWVNQRVANGRGGEYGRFYDKVREYAPKDISLRIIVETVDGYKYLSSTIDKNNAKKDVDVLVNLGEKELGGIGTYKIAVALDAPGGGYYLHEDTLSMTKYFSIYVSGDTCYKDQYWLGFNKYDPKLQII